MSRRAASIAVDTEDGFFFPPAPDRAPPQSLSTLGFLPRIECGFSLLNFDILRAKARR
jgi:hypothetical protein